MRTRLVPFVFAALAGLTVVISFMGMIVMGTGTSVNRS